MSKQPTADLPPLPEPSPTHYTTAGLRIDRMDMFTAKQMQAYARAALAQAQASLTDDLVKANREIARLTTALAKIADWDASWGPFPENNEAWRSMAVITAREAVQPATQAAQPPIVSAYRVNTKGGRSWVVNGAPSARDLAEIENLGDSAELLGVTVKQSLAVEQPVEAQGAPDFDRMRHIANEWADMATNGLQWLQNISIGIGTVDEALANMDSNYAHCRKVNDAPGRYGAVAPQQAQGVPAPRFNTSKAGRDQVAKFFVEHLKRHDFTRYIKEALAADFACALAHTLYAVQAAPQQGAKT